MKHLLPRRLPIVPTLIVGLAAAAMIGLGIWQLERKQEKEALLARLAANMHKPMIAFPSPPIGDALLFRRAGALCLEVTGWSREGGRSARGTLGWRQIAQCRTGAEGPALLVDMGVSADAQFTSPWKGGRVTGTITHAPDHRTLIEQIFAAHGPKPLMLVADAPAPGLELTPKPGLGSVPNNHLAYAVQWFLFALLAVIIYLLALKRRERGEPPTPRT